jgi:uncharacterized membrane protein
MSGQALLAQVLLSAGLAFILAVSLLGLGVGLGLMLKSAATLSFIASMNRWVSMRRALERLEAPIHIAPRAAAGKRAFALILLAAGTYALVVLLGSFDVERLALAVKVHPRHSLASLGLEVLKWTLVAGAAAAVLAAFMLLFFPRAWQRLEERANRWYSTRELERAGDTMYLPLERTVQGHPRIAGGLLFAFSLAAAVGCGLLLFSAR